VTPLQQVAAKRKNGTKWTVRIAKLLRIIDAEETLTALAVNLDGDVVDEYTGPWEQCRAFAYLRLETTAWKVELVAEHGEGIIGLLMPGTGVQAEQAHVPMPGLAPPRARTLDGNHPYQRGRVKAQATAERSKRYVAATDRDTSQPSGLSFRWRQPT
jgi:hypothetical protein